MPQNLQAPRAVNNATNPAPRIARIYPPDITQALISAGRRRDAAMIDALTDELARRGFVRPRHADDGRPVRGWQ